MYKQFTGSLPLSRTKAPVYRNQVKIHIKAPTVSKEKKMFTKLTFLQWEALLIFVQFTSALEGEANICTGVEEMEPTYIRKNPPKDGDTQEVIVWNGEVTQSHKRLHVMFSYNEDSGWSPENVTFAERYLHHCQVSRWSKKFLTEQSDEDGTYIFIPITFPRNTWLCMGHEEQQKAFKKYCCHDN